MRLAVFAWTTLKRAKSCEFCPVTTDTIPNALILGWSSISEFAHSAESAFLTVDPATVQIQKTTKEPHFWAEDQAPVQAPETELLPAEVELQRGLALPVSCLDFSNHRQNF